MKVKLLIPKRIHYPNPLTGTIHLTSALPFFAYPHSVRAHRIRSAQIHLYNKRYTHTSISFWCGGSGFVSEKPKHNGQFLQDTNLPVCGTCEGRATGAGQLNSHTIAGKFVVFTPRLYEEES